MTIAEFARLSNKILSFFRHGQILFRQISHMISSYHRRVIQSTDYILYSFFSAAIIAQTTFFVDCRNHVQSTRSRSARVITMRVIFSPWLTSPGFCPVRFTGVLLPASDFLSVSQVKQWLEKWGKWVTFPLAVHVWCMRHTSFLRLYFHIRFL